MPTAAWDSTNQAKMAYTVAEWSDVSVTTASGRIAAAAADTLIASTGAPGTGFTAPAKAVLQLLPRPWGAGDASANRVADTWLPVQKGLQNRQGLALALDPTVKLT